MAKKRLVGGTKEEFKIDGNFATYSGPSDRSPRTLEEFLEVIKVDLKVWRVVKWKAIIRDQAAMPRTVRDPKSGKWVRGSTTPIVTPLYQINAEFVRIVPEQVGPPPIAPVVVNVPKAPAVVRRETLGAGTFTTLFIPDIQCGFHRNIRTGRLNPFHDRRAMDIVWQVNRALKPDRVVQLGDNMDFPEFGRWRRKPEFYFTTQPAICELGAWEGKLVRDNPSAEHDYIEGNHDARIVNEVIDHNFSAYGLRPADDMEGSPAMSVPRLLGLDALGIKYHGPYPDGEVWINDNCAAHHGLVVKSESGATTKQVVKEARYSEIQGHIHRAEVATKTVHTRRGPKYYQSMSPGTLARLDPGAVPGVKPRQNWQNAFGWGLFQPGNGFYHLQVALIYGDVALFEGRVWNARSYDEVTEEMQGIVGKAISIT